MISIGVNELSRNWTNSYHSEKYRYFFQVRITVASDNNNGPRVMVSGIYITFLTYEMYIN